MKKNNGFTLIEVLIAMAISLIVLAAIYGVFASVSKSYTIQNVNRQVEQKVRAAVDYMVRDIRVAGYDRMDTGLFGAVTAEATTFRYQTDRGNIDGQLTPPDDTDGISNDDLEDIAFTLDGQDLKMVIYNGGVPLDPPDVIISNVTDLTFKYYDGSNPPVETSVLGDIRSVDVSITIQEEAGIHQTVSRQMTTRVRCRNLGI